MKRIYNLEAFEWYNTGPASQHDVMAFEPCVVRRVKMLGDLGSLQVVSFWMAPPFFHCQLATSSIRTPIPAMVFSPIAVVPICEGIELDRHDRIGIEVEGTGRFRFAVEVEADGPCRCPSCLNPIAHRDGPVHWYHWLCDTCRLDFDDWVLSKHTEKQFDTWMVRLNS